MPRVCSQNSMSVCLRDWVRVCQLVTQDIRLSDLSLRQWVRWFQSGLLFGFRNESEPKAKEKRIEKRTNWKIYLCLNKHFRNALQSRSAVSSGRTDVHPHLQPGWQFTLALRHLATSPKGVHVRKRCACPVHCMQIILYCRLQVYVLHN